MTVVVYYRCQHWERIYCSWVSLELLNSVVKVNHVHCLHTTEISLPRYYRDEHPCSMMYILIFLYAMGSLPAC